MRQQNSNNNITNTHTCGQQEDQTENERNDAFALKWIGSNIQTHRRQATNVTHRYTRTELNTLVEHRHHSYTHNTFKFQRNTHSKQERDGKRARTSLYIRETHGSQWLLVLCLVFLSHILFKVAAAQKAHTCTRLTHMSRRKS